jgi:hypothetical protein
MSQTHRNSIAENGESMDEAPAPHLIGHRKKFDAFERDLTGGHHIGHLPVYVLEIEGWTFRRCRCGFSLALTPSGAIWWLRTTKDAMEIKSFKSLLRALNSNCWAHPRPEPVKDVVISPPAIERIAAETREPPGCRKYRTATSLIGDAKRAESEERGGAGADAAGRETATSQAAKDLCSQRHHADNALAAKSS